MDLQDAIDALNCLQTPFAVIEARRKAGIKPNEASMHEMRVYLTRIGYSVRGARAQIQPARGLTDSHVS